MSQDKKRPAFKGKCREQILADWTSFLEFLHPASPYQIGHIVGPLYIGICLNRTSNVYKYRPTAFCTNLGFFDFPEALGFSMTLSQISDIHIAEISVDQHPEHYRKAADTIVRTYPPLRVNGYNYEDYKDSLFECLRNRHGHITTVPANLSAVAVFLAWKEGTQSAMQFMTDEWKKHYPALRQRGSDIRDTLGPTFYSRTAELVSNPQAIQVLVTERLKEFGLLELPRHSI